MACVKSKRPLPVAACRASGPGAGFVTPGSAQALPPLMQSRYQVTLKGLRPCVRPYGPTAPAPDLQLRMLSELLLKTWHSEEQIEEEPERERERKRAGIPASCPDIVLVVVLLSLGFMRRVKFSEGLGARS